MKKLLIVPILVLFGCKTVKVDQSYDNYLSDSNVNLYAFVGKKLSVKKFNPNKPPRNRMVYDSITKDSIEYESFVMDLGFKCKYLVVQKIFNDPKAKIIEFEAYDHYGRPGFANYNYVLIYLSKKSDGSGFYHQKYQFDPIKNRKGKWTGLNGESLEALFQKKKETVFKARELFE